MIRKSLRCAASLALVSFVARAAAAQQISEPKTPYELALAATIAALPEAPRGFVHQHLASIEDVLFTQTAASSSPLTAEWQGHFILLDAAATETDWSVRLAAAKSFPRTRKDARKLFQERGVKDGGELPWLMEDQYAKLVAALRKNDAAAAERHIGMIIHLATDAALPFNTSTLAIDELGEKAPGQDSPSGRRLRDRFHGTFIDRLKGRLAYEIRVSPLRVQTVPSPAEAAFDTLLQAHHVALELAEIDAETIRLLGLTDLDAFAASADIYVAALGEAVAPLLESQIESGALLAANLILTAWNAARPDFADEAPAPSDPAGTQAAGAQTPTAAPGPAVSAPPAPAQETSAPAGRPSSPGDSSSEKRRPAKPASDDQGPNPLGTPAPSALSGSLSSTVYHRGDCSHVARIKPENRVEFKTKAEAEAAGRKPCRACKPDLESPPPKPDK